MANWQKMNCSLKALMGLAGGARPGLVAGGEVDLDKAADLAVQVAVVLAAARGVVGSSRADDPVALVMVDRADLVAPAASLSSN